MSQAITAARQESTTSPVRTASVRFWEVDSWRGLVIVTMIIFHLMWDLKAFADLYVILHRGFWFYFQRFTATSFIMLAGISVVISYNRALAKRGRPDGLQWKLVKRGLHVLGVGLIISLAVRLAGVGRIDFGVLHLIGTSIVLAYPFLRFRWLNLAIAAVLLPLSYALKAIPVPPGVYWGVPLGLAPPNYIYLDYFPLVHWFAVFLIGMFLGNSLYANGKRQFTLPDFSAFFPLNVLQFLGRHSLVIYVIHQPILVALLVVTGIANLGVIG